MTNEAQLSWRALRDELHDRYERAKDPQGAVVELLVRYRALDSDVREQVNQEIGRWLTSDDDGLRYDALALVDKYELHSLTEELHELQTRLEGETGPGAPYEWAKVNRILGNLRESDG